MALGKQCFYPKTYRYYGVVSLSEGCYICICTYVHMLHMFRGQAYRQMNIPGSSRKLNKVSDNNNKNSQNNCADCNKFLFLNPSGQPHYFTRLFVILKPTISPLKSHVIYTTPITKIWLFSNYALLIVRSLRGLF